MLYTGVASLLDRTLPASGASEAATGGYDMFNIVFIVGFALLITTLARYFARRPRGRK